MARNEVETEVPAEKVFNLRGVRYYILALSLTDTSHEGKNYLKHMGKVHLGPFDVCVGKALQLSSPVFNKKAEVSGLYIKEAKTAE